MNAPLDVGLVACTILAALGIAGVCLWLYGAGHLDQIDRPSPPRVGRTAGRTSNTRTATSRRAKAPSPRAVESERIRQAIADWRGHATVPLSTRSTGPSSRPGYGMGATTSHPRELPPAQARRQPRRTS